MNYVIKPLFLVSFLLFIISCKSDDRIDNPFLPNIGVNFVANLNLPQFGSLEFPGNTEVVSTDGIGIKGLIIHNALIGGFRAYELSDPNHLPNSCSSQTVSGSISSCTCNDDNSYDLNTGVPISGGGQYGLRAYRISKQGNTLVISN